MSVKERERQRQRVKEKTLWTDMQSEPVNGVKAFEVNEKEPARKKTDRNKERERTRLTP